MTKPLEIQSYSEWNLFTRQERPLMIAGPCSAESEEQLFNTATQLKNNGIEVLRAGIWKPRTKPGGFEGVGTEGLAWLKKVKETTGMYTATEVANQHHVFEALKHGGCTEIRDGYGMDWRPFYGKPVCCSGNCGIFKRS